TLEAELARTQSSKGVSPALDPFMPAVSLKTNALASNERSTVETVAASRRSPGPEAEVGALLTPAIPDHELLRCIGQGPYGNVWLARTLLDGYYHAVKVIYRRRFSSDAPYERELRGVKKFTPISLNHPGWVHILQVGKNDDQGYFYYVMELGDDEASGQTI